MSWFWAPSFDIVFLSAALDGPDVAGGLRRCLAQVERAVGLHRIIRQSFFVADDATRRAAQHIVNETYKHRLPATGYLLQPPLGGPALALEAWALVGDAAVAQRDGLSVARAPGLELAFLGCLETEEGETIRDGARRVLNHAHQRLTEAGFPLSSLVRTWYYIGDILGDGDGGHRYEEFNCERNLLYRGAWGDPGCSPASTGIGAATGRVALEWMALSATSPGVETVWLDNPLQTKPCRYPNGVDRAHKPAFSRGAALLVPDAVMILVSGTAAIRNSDVVAKGNPVAQTEVTIENIATLIGQDKLVETHGVSQGATLGDIQQYRVYVKRPRDMDAIRGVCQRRLPDVPAVWVQADVCYAECLVEIEAVAAFRRALPAP
jgi:enamine deaminase RidA (YjgF/YER057c/UK114 family)